MASEEDKTIQFTLRIPREHAERLKELAEKEDRTASAEVRRLIRQHVEKMAA